MLVINGLDDLSRRVGETLGTGDWCRVSQHDVDLFVDVTHDDQWIHVDRERAAESPFGGTIVHGYFTLALLPFLHSSIFRVDNVGHSLNYGLETVRFPAPLPVGSRVRAEVTVVSVTERGDGRQAKFLTSISAEQVTKPVCVATSLVLYLDADHVAGER